MNDAEHRMNLDALDIRRLLAALPHRYPFLLVDRIIEVNAGQSAIGIKNVTFNEPHFTGHFPENPVMPGVLILEAMAQTAGAICLLHTGPERPPLVYLTGIRDAIFRIPVVPGDQLRIHVNRIRDAKKLGEQGFLIRFACTAKVMDKVAAEAKVTAMIGYDRNDKVAEERNR